MSISELKDAIVADLLVELSGDSMLDQTILASKVDGAIREVREARCYPNSSYYTEEVIVAELSGRFYSAIKRIALYDYNQIGIEGQSISAENGENRTFVDRKSLFYGVLPLSD
jgi:hypothetical protein